MALSWRYFKEIRFLEIWFLPLAAADGDEFGGFMASSTDTGDRALLRLVWINLLANAAKYTGMRKQPRIEVAGTRKGTETIYSVADNGVGFDMQYAGKLFGVFQRLHAEEECPGTGVGLSFVQRIVNRHGDRVWAEAAVDKGATFFFALPIGNSPQS
jgi:light-regulated signal transduction histidine kinase (bacteriophytochrome)